jgi:outer membrane protein TolC
MKISMAFVLPLLALASGCAPYRYHVAPASPPALAASLEARSLDDSGLRNWMQRAGFQPSSWPLAVWDLRALTLAAYYFNTDMDVARANAAAASAAIKTAAMKPNPSVSADAGYETAPESPYLLGLNFSLPIVTAGKRGYGILLQLSFPPGVAHPTGVRTVGLFFANMSKSEHPWRPLF